MTNNKQQNKLIDPFGREISYLRLSVTDRCNLRCTYCMSEKMTFLPKKLILSQEEMVQIAQAFVELGVKKIRLTGGEPLVRQGILSLAQHLTALDGLHELTMTTNATLLENMAVPLQRAGMKRLNISLDSLKEDRFNAMSRTGKLEDAIRGIDAAIAARYQRLKINSVILAGENDDEIVDLARFAIERDMDISFIEEMPLGHIDSHARDKTQVSSQSIREKLEQHFTLLESTETTGGPSRYLKVANTDCKIGFISPLSNNFCSACNRVRLTAEGRLLLCLGNEHSLDLRKEVREHPGDIAHLKTKISEAIGNKPERHHFDPNKTEIIRFMNMTGG